MSRAKRPCVMTGLLYYGLTNMLLVRVVVSPLPDLSSITRTSIWGKGARLRSQELVSVFSFRWSYGLKIALRVLPPSLFLSRSSNVIQL